jgi:hypothetical protein
MVRTTRRERFMVLSCVGDDRGQFHPADAAWQAKAAIFHGIVRQPPPEKCEEKACANPPKPPRCTPPEPESEVPDDEWLEESPP